MGNVHMEATQINYRGGSKKMSVEEAIKAAGTEITPEEKTWIDSIPTLASGKADNDVIAPEFDSEAGVYAIGDLVMHEGKLYEFTAAHETAGDWDSTEVTEKTVADEVNSVKSGLTMQSITFERSGDVHEMPTISRNGSYKIGNLCVINVKMDFTTGIGSAFQQFMWAKCGNTILKPKTQDTLSGDLQIVYLAGNNGNCIILRNGAIANNEAISANTSIIISGTFFV